MSPRDVIVAEAKDWIGTPYRHQQSVKGTGCDCLGLVRGIWRAVIGPEPTEVPGYTPDWAERHGAETLLSAAQTWLCPIAIEAIRPGDVLLFRMRRHAPVKHCAIVSGEGQMIHAWQGRAVTETPLCAWWGRHLAAASAFPLPEEI